jgi:hypothetical protein
MWTIKLRVDNGSGGGYIDAQLAATLKLAPVWIYSEMSWRPAFRRLVSAHSRMHPSLYVQLGAMCLTVGGVDFHE